MKAYLPDCQKACYLHSGDKTLDLKTGYTDKEKAAVHSKHNGIATEPIIFLSVKKLTLLSGPYTIPLVSARLEEWLCLELLLVDPRLHLPAKVMAYLLLSNIFSRLSHGLRGLNPCLANSVNRMIGQRIVYF